MSRKPSGSPEAVQWALETTKSTESAIEIRRALAVVLPVMHGLSLKQTAELVGRSQVWVAKERRNFIQEQPRNHEGSKRGGRKNQLIPAEDEDAFMEKVCQQYTNLHLKWRFGLIRGPFWYKQILVSFVEFVQTAIEKKIQRKTTRTTTYNLMARVGKRRFINYKPSMWKEACFRELPSAAYDVDDIPDLLIKRYGLVRRKRRAKI